MPRLLTPGLGDLLDRASILLLKLRVGRAAGIDVEHFEDESDEILAALLQVWVSNPSTAQDQIDIDRHAGELSAANDQLWTATDQMHVLASQVERLGPEAGRSTLVNAGELGVRILRLNDERCRLVKVIDQLAGTYRGEEKL